jgi:hypothetical protein
MPIHTNRKKIFAITAIAWVEADTMEEAVDWYYNRELSKLDFNLRGINQVERWGDRDEKREGSGELSSIPTIDSVKDNKGLTLP